MMKFKVGDKVVIRKDLVINNIYGTQSFVGSMIKFIGKTCEINGAI